MRTRAAAAFVAALTLVSVGSAACGGAEDAGAAKSIEIWTMGDKGKAMDEVGVEFTKETGIELKVQSIPWKNARDKMSTAIASGKGPDVVQVGHSFLAEFSDAGALLDLSDKLAGSPDLAAGNFFPASAETMKVGGKVASVPWIADTRVLFYRTDLLASAGYPKAPATWDETKSAATKLAARGDGNYGIGLNTDDQFLPIILTWGAGGEVAQGAQATFDTPQFRRALEFQQSFFAGGLTPKKAQPDPDMVQGFKTGRIPMFVSGPYMATLLKAQAPELAGKWAVAPMPKDQSGTSLMAGSNLAIFSKSTKVDQSLQLIAYLGRKATQEKWFQVTNDLPARQDALEALSGGGDANLAVYHQQMQNAKIVPQIRSWGAVAPEMVRAVQKVCIAGDPLDATISSFATKAKELTAAK